MIVTFSVSGAVTAVRQAVVAVTVVVALRHATALAVALAARLFFREPLGRGVEVLVAGERRLWWLFVLLCYFFKSKNIWGLEFTLSYND